MIYMANGCKVLEEEFPVLREQNEVETIYLEPKSKAPCKDVVELLGGAIKICVKKGENGCKYLGSNVVVRGAYAKIHAVGEDIVGTHKACTQDYKKLLSAMILLSLAAGHPETAIALYKKMLMMNALGGHDFAL